jgi:predicted RNA-binding Zn-ribbon protein involved in translation (DUF1610 family)
VIHFPNINQTWCLFVQSVQNFIDYIFCPKYNWSEYHTGGSELGSILLAKCKCGYVSSEIYAGGGFLNSDTLCRVPAMCQTCGEVVEVNLLESDTKCPKCKGNVSIYSNKALFKDSIKVRRENKRPDIFDWSIKGKINFILSDFLYFCPKCKKYSLRFEDTGCWD